MKFKSDEYQQVFQHLLNLSTVATNFNLIRYTFQVRHKSIICRHLFKRFHIFAVCMVKQAFESVISSPAPEISFHAGVAQTTSQIPSSCYLCTLGGTYFFFVRFVHFSEHLRKLITGVGLFFRLLIGEYDERVATNYLSTAVLLICSNNCKLFVI